MTDFLQDMAILLVDDEPHILSALQRVLRREPYSVFTAGSGAQGLQVLAEHAIHMVVTDQRMPEMEGTVFLQRVKENWPETLRVVLSGYAEASAIVAAINKGEIYRFIGKPWKDDELKATIRQCLEHYLIVRENRMLSEQSVRQVAELKRLNGLLENSIVERTHALQFSQEVLESLPSLVLGISQDHELMVTNQRARDDVPDIAAAIPGCDIAEVLPDSALEGVLECLERGASEPFDVTWSDRRFRARRSRLGSEDAPRGCVLILDEVET